MIEPAGDTAETCRQHLRMAFPDSTVTDDDHMAAFNMRGDQFISFAQQSGTDMYRVVSITEINRTSNG